MKEKKINLKEKWKDPKYKATIKLSLYILLIISVILYLNISRAFSSNNNLNNTQNIIDKEANDNLLSSLNSENYEYNINITISHNTNNEEKEEESKDETKIEDQEINNEATIITYSGKRNKDIITVIKNNTDEYYINDNTYYKKIKDQYELTNENDLFDTIESRYIDINNIQEYIKKGHIEHDTNDGNSILTVIQVPINAIIPSHQGLEEISFEILEEDSNVTININYTELMKLDDETITNYEVRIEFFNIDKISEIIDPTLQ